MPHAKPASTVRPRLSRAIMAGTVALVLFMLATAVYAPDLHYALSVEDSFVEYLTFGGLLLAAAVLASRWWRFRENQGAAWQAVYLLGALAALFGAGEEVSWGQRIFGWATSEAFAANRQSETNLHNLDVAGYNVNKVVFTYGLGAALGAYYLLLPFLARRFAGLRRGLTQLGVPVPTGLISAWFVLGLVLVVLIPSLDKWEILEVLVPAGALAVLWERGVVLRSKSLRSKKV